MKNASVRFRSLPAAVKLMLFALSVLICGSVRSLIAARFSAPSPVTGVSVSAGLRILLLFVPFLLYELLGTGRFTGSLSYGRLSLKRLPLYFAAMQLISVLAGIITRAVCRLLPNGEAALTAAAEYGTLSVPALLITAFDLCVFTPLLEEYVFRGVIFGLLKQHGTRFAILSGAILFAIAHAGADRVMYAFCAGLFMALLYSRVRDIRVTVLLHALNNACSLLIDAVLPRLLPTNVLLITVWSYLTVIAVCGTVSLILLIRYYRADKDGMNT